MPPRDPRLRPALEVARPGDSGAFNGYRPGNNEPLLFLFGDGGWHPVRVRGRWTDRHGRDVAEVEWSIAGDTWSESYLVDPGKTREG